MTLDWAVLISALMLGLAGAGHCIGMCGGISAAVGVSTQATRGQLLWFIPLYNFGRITSYTLMGFIAAWLVSHLGTSPWPIARTLAAFIMFLLGCYFMGWAHPILQLEKHGRLLWRHIQPLSQRLLPADTPLKALSLGGLWGWLPCGLVYSALAYSATQPSALMGAGVMLCFGLGTLPALVVAGFMFSKIRGVLQKRSVMRTLGVFYIIFAVWTLAAAWYHVVAHQNADSELHHHPIHH